MHRKWQRELGASVFKESNGFRSVIIRRSETDRRDARTADARNLVRFTVFVRRRAGSASAKRDMRDCGAKSARSTGIVRIRIITNHVKVRKEI